MSDEQWLRERLADAVPEPPINPDRARSAEKLARRRRRTTAAGALGVVGVIAGAAALTAALANGDGGRSGDDQVADPPPVVECPPAKAKDGVVQGTAIDQPDPSAPDAVPDGATSARICQGPGTTVEVSPDPVPDATELAATINALLPTAPPEICPMDLGPGFRIVFGYADGSRFVVSVKLYGCQEVVVGSGYRTATQALTDALTAVSDLRQTAP